MNERIAEEFTRLNVKSLNLSETEKTDLAMAIKVNNDNFMNLAQMFKELEQMET